MDCIDIQQDAVRTKAGIPTLVSKWPEGTSRVTCASEWSVMEAVERSMFLDALTTGWLVAFLLLLVEVFLLLLKNAIL